MPYTEYSALTFDPALTVNNLVQVAELALLLAAIGRSDMSLQYMFVIYVGMQQSEVYTV